MRRNLTSEILVGIALFPVSEQAKARSDDLVLRGAWEYHEACAACHGHDGAGDGTMGAILKVAPTDLTKLSERNGGTFPFERVFRVIDGRVPIGGRTYRREALDEGGPAIFGGNPDLIVAGRIYVLAQHLRAIQGGKRYPWSNPHARGGYGQSIFLSGSITNDARHDWSDVCRS